MKFRPKYRRERSGPQDELREILNAPRGIYPDRPMDSPWLRRQKVRLRAGEIDVTRMCCENARQYAREVAAGLHPESIMAQRMRDGGHGRTKG